MVRPSEDVLNHFYGLADCNDAKRLKSVAAIVHNVKSSDDTRDYCLERLIGGLSSSRAAARIGYATALTHALAGGSPWSFKKINEQMDKSLDLEDKEMASNNAIGQHLVLAALLDCGSFKKETSTILEKQLALSARFAFLSLSTCDVIATGLLQMNAADVKKQTWSTLKAPIKSSALKAEIVYLVLLLRKHIGSLLSDAVPYVSSEGKLKWHDLSETFLADILKGMEKGCAHIFIQRWLAAAKEDGEWKNGCDKVVKWAKANEKVSTERLFRVSQQALEIADTAKEISIACSPDLLARIAKMRSEKRNPLTKVHLAAVNTIAGAISDKIAALPSATTAPADLYALLITLEAAHMDTLAKTARPMEKILEKMDEDHVRLYVNKCVSSPSSLRRLLGVFPSWPLSIRKTALSALLTLSKESGSKSNDVFITLAQCIDSLFRIKVKAGEQASASITEENEDLLMKLMKKTEDGGWKNTEKTIRGAASQHLKKPLVLLYVCISLWRAVTPDSQEAADYGETLKEIVVVAKSAPSEENTMVLVDLLISLLSQPRRFHRTLVCLVFSAILPTLGAKSTGLVEHLLKIVTSSDAELSGDKGDEEEEEDEEMEEGGDGDEDMASEGDDDDDEEESEEEEDDETDVGEVDTQLVERLQSALGKAAVTSGDEDDDDGPIETVDDEEMFKLDEGLVAAFKAIGGQSVRGAAASRFAKPLRMRVCDLLLFVVSSKDTSDEAKIALILPLVRTTIKLSHEKKDEEATKKMIELLSIVAHLKKITSTEATVLSVVAGLEKEATTVTNPFLHDIIGDLIGFLCSILARPSLSSSAHTAFISLFDRFIQQDTNALPAPVASAPIARCPVAFASDAAHFIKIAFDDNVRIFRRTEALQCALTLARKDVLRDSSGSGKSAGKALAPLLPAALSFPEGASDKVKPRFMAMLLKLLQQLVQDDEAKAALSSKLLPLLDDLLSREDTLFKNGGPLAKCNSACQKVASRSALALIQLIHKKLQ